jgi:hypothetical protein
MPEALSGKAFKDRRRWGHKVVKIFGNISRVNFVYWHIMRGRKACIAA